MRRVLFLFLLLASFSGSAQTVYKTPSGKKYHLADCRMVEHTATALTIAQAVETGLTPCSFCKPGTAHNVQRAIGDGKGTAVGEQPQTVQCRGTTRAGTRCLHKTSMADGYCYQHRP